jgi:diazepam-binding inhibitor (GABA receptor modulating acyl-CoA-binding protein)
MQAEFEKAQKKIKTEQPFKPVNNYVKLDFYSLFKQTTIGDVNIERPGFFDFEGKAKWDAWKSREGMSKDDAMFNYIKLTQEYYN